MWNEDRDPLIEVRHWTVTSGSPYVISLMDPFSKTKTLLLTLKKKMKIHQAVFSVAVEIKIISTFINLSIDLS